MEAIELKLCALFPQLEIGPGPEGVSRYVREVERMGYDDLAVHDHVLGADPDREAGWSGPHASAPHTYQDLFHEPLVLFGFAAALTTRLELTTAILNLPQRQTALVAKQAAEIDVLTNGRLRLGVGIGWNKVEFEGLGACYKDRGRRIEEQIELLRELWTRQVIDFHGRWHRVDRAGLTPLPVRRPIPLWMGGGYVPSTRTIVEPALRRIARLADGWLAQIQSGDELAIDRFRQFVRESGRDERSVGLEGRVNAFHGKPEDWQREVEWWRRMGATHVELNTMKAGFTSLEQHLDALGRFVAVVRAG